MSRVLTVDIGNSNIVVGSWNSDELEFSDRIVSKRNYAQDELSSLLNNVVLKNKCTARSHADSDEVYDGAILSSTGADRSSVFVCDGSISTPKS